jgi:hypothetical protein
MLINSFLHIPGVGAVTEKRLWTAGLLDWHQVDSAGSCDISAKSLMRIAACMAESCENLDGVDGFFAVLLWQEFAQTGSTKALETLLAYNIEDVVNLETLMVLAYNMKLKETPFSKTHALPLPGIPDIPFKLDRSTIDRIRQKNVYFF